MGISRSAGRVFGKLPKGVQIVVIGGLLFSFFWLFRIATKPEPYRRPTPSQTISQSYTPASSSQMETITAFLDHGLRITDGYSTPSGKSGFTLVAAKIRGVGIESGSFVGVWVTNGRMTLPVNHVAHNFCSECGVQIVSNTKLNISMDSNARSLQRYVEEK